MDATLSLKFSRFEPTLPSEDLVFCEGIRLTSETPQRSNVIPAQERPAAVPARGGVFAFQLDQAVEKITGRSAPAAPRPSAFRAFEHSLSVFFRIASK